LTGARQDDELMPARRSPQMPLAEAIGPPPPITIEKKLRQDCGHNRQFPGIDMA
jgi:hypothetical protein